MCWLQSLFHLLGHSAFESFDLVIHLQSRSWELVGAENFLINLLVWQETNANLNGVISVNILFGK